MAEQEFLASFGVEIDESGVERLQRALRENRALAEELAEAFRKAREALRAFFRDLSELSFADAGALASSRVTEQPEGIHVPFSLDFTKANQELSLFRKTAGKALRLSADASAVVSAGRSALSALQSLFASIFLPLQAKVSVSAAAEGTAGIAGAGGTAETAGTAGAAGSSGESSGGTGAQDSGSSGAQDSGSAEAPSSGTRQPAPARQETGIHAVLQAATGGRFEEKTTTEIAEDGDPEYVIPVKKESLAVPLLRQAVGEMSRSAQESLRQGMPGPGASDIREALADLPGMLSAAGTVLNQTLNQSTTQNHVQAPVSIEVHAAGASPEAVGRSVYDVAEQYLLRTLETGMSGQ